LEENTVAATHVEQPPVGVGKEAKEEPMVPGDLLP
jgi:hypothetical protein